MCGKKGHFARDCFSRANHSQDGERGRGRERQRRAGKEYVYTIEYEINDVNLSQDGCVEREDGLVMIDSGASVNVCPRWFGNAKLEQSGWCNLSQRCKRKTAPGIRKETDLVENVRFDETI